MNLYSNENFDNRVVRELRRLGHNVLTTFEAGRANQQIGDDEVLSFAIQEDRAVLTYNRRHFVRLHRRQPQHTGIIVCTDDADPLALAARIHAEISKHSSLSGELIRIVRPNLMQTQREQGE